MANGGINRLRHSCGGPVTAAVVRRTKERAALDDAPRDRDIRHLWIATLHSKQLNIHGSTTGSNHRMSRRVPVRGPLPHIADHVVDPIAIGWKLSDRCSPLIPIRGQVLPGKLALPGICHVFSAWSKVFPPRVGCVLQSTSRGVLPLCFRRNLFPHPLCVGLGVLVRNVNDRMLCPLVDGTLGAFGVSPICSRNVLPPVVMIAKIHA